MLYNMGIQIALGAAVLLARRKGCSGPTLVLMNRQWTIYFSCMVG